MHSHRQFTPAAVKGQGDTPTGGHPLPTTTHRGGQRNTQPGSMRPLTRMQTLELGQTTNLETSKGQGNTQPGGYLLPTTAHRRGQHNTQTGSMCPPRRMMKQGQTQGIPPETNKGQGDTLTGGHPLPTATHQWGQRNTQTGSMRPPHWMIFQEFSRRMTRIQPSWRYLRTLSPTNRCQHARSIPKRDIVEGGLWTGPDPRFQSEARSSKIPFFRYIT
jgi:hypothetical protein